MIEKESQNRNFDAAFGTNFRIIVESVFIEASRNLCYFLFNKAAYKYKNTNRHVQKVMN